MMTTLTSEKRLARTREGLTLVEIMVAVSLLAVIMVALLMAFQQAQRAFRTGTSQVDVLENGRAVMNLVTRDLLELSAMEMPGAVNFCVRSCPTASPRDLPLPNGTSVILLEELFFLSRHGDDWAATKYTLQEDEAGSGVATLYRATTNVTWLDAANLLDTNLVTEGTGPVNNLNPKFHRVAEGIVHFAFQAIDPYGNPITPAMVTNTTEIDVFPVPGSPYMNYKFSNTNMPAFVDIELGILEPATLKAFEAKHAISPAAAYGFLTQRVGKIHMFRHRIPVRAQSRIST